MATGRAWHGMEIDGTAVNIDTEAVHRGPWPRVGCRARRRCSREHERVPRAVVDARAWQCSGMHADGVQRVAPPLGRRGHRKVQMGDERCSRELRAVTTRLSRPGCCARGPNPAAACRGRQPAGGGRPSPTARREGRPPAPSTRSHEPCARRGPSFPLARVAGRRRRPHDAARAPRLLGARAMRSRVRVCSPRTRVTRVYHTRARVCVRVCHRGHSLAHAHAAHARAYIPSILSSTSW